MIFWLFFLVLCLEFSFFFWWMDLLEIRTRLDLRKINRSYVQKLLIQMFLISKEQLSKERLSSERLSKSIKNVRVFDCETSLDNFLIRNTSISNVRCGF